MTNENPAKELTVWQAIEVLTKAISHKTKLELKMHNQINELGKHLDVIEAEVRDIKSSLHSELNGASHVLIDTDATNVIFITSADLHNL
ncbi:hypothetical protein [Wolbachia endosymbiont (group E) of Neria commutata]|uniref:hypothetical protein n=1 Tax=Wolbachia endosymbiont (group E) of Neria commutata TaxID=3066149 RepID=UPI0031333E54